MIATFITIFIVLAIIFGVFSSIGWCVGIFNRNLNSDQRIKAGLFITIYFFAMICFNGWQWSNGADKLEEKRGNAFRNSNPGYYNPNSVNFGNERPDSYELIKAKEDIEAYDDKMTKKILLWLGGYIMLFIVGYIGESIYPLPE